jgi:dipeptidase E
VIGEQRQILAMGGGGFTMGERSPALDRFVLELTSKSVPRICFLPTASGDPREQVLGFYERFGDWPCEPSVLSLFHLTSRDHPVEHLLSQDAIYVGGGSMRNMLAVWREHGIDRAMRAAWSRGTVLAGLSAGAMCWFAGGVSRSGGAPEPVAGLGFLSGSLSVHLDGESTRLPVFRTAIAAGELPLGYAVDDGAALLYAGRRLVDCVASRAGARVVLLAPDDSGGVREQEMRVRRLPGAERAWPEEIEAPYAISELRALRAGRHRWD